MFRPAGTRRAVLPSLFAGRSPRLIDRVARRVCAVLLVGGRSPARRAVGKPQVEMAGWIADTAHVPLLDRQLAQLHC